MSKVDYNKRQFKLWKYDFEDENPFINYDLGGLMAMIRNPKLMANEILNQMQREKTKKERRENYLKSLIKEDRSYD